MFGGPGFQWLEELLPDPGNVVSCSSQSWEHRCQRLSWRMIVWVPVLGNLGNSESIIGAAVGSSAILVRFLVEGAGREGFPYQTPSQQHMSYN